MIEEEKRPQSNCRVHGLVFNVTYLRTVNNNKKLYVCRICSNRRNSKYRSGDKYKNASREYKESGRLKEMRDIYLKTEKSIEARKKYGKSEEARKAKKKYDESKKGRIRRMEYFKDNCNRESYKLNDGYISGLLIRGGDRLSRDDLPYSMIELKRTQLKLKRKLKNENN